MLNKNQKSSSSAESFMQNLMETLNKQQPVSTPSATSEKDKSTKAPSKSSSSGIKFDDEDLELDSKTVDMLTQKLAQDLSSKGFLNDSDDSDDGDLDDLSDDEEFKKQLLQEFKNLNSLSQDKQGNVPKSKLKQIYIELLKSGQSMITDKNTADHFISKLQPNELSSLMNLLQKEPDDAIKFFNNDPQVIEAVKNTAMVGSDINAKIWQNLTEDDLEDEDLESANDTNITKKLLEKASDAVKEALKVFEDNLLHYTQNPQQLLQLCEKLPDKDQSLFLDILFRDYTPDKISKRLKEKEKTEQKKDLEKEMEIFDDDLVAHVFKEILTHFKAYKKHPEKFKPLVDRLNEREQKALNALIKAFWDINMDIVKK
ncbi:hypothetical protein C9374_004505 [Naegleria lovaniensis]|uniref:Uncharacterized protein n=1 Tax=Naegleria lovaniensis TaxID=51637 RepID=A0AA88GRH9_NAELO|nr:uncharacterized protein C9374_004505 [Naegleria lovaniensis]KAG2383168.1 hypothetical protein C9374_004505 [Naegleria lovaniensis]